MQNQQLQQHLNQAAEIAKQAKAEEKYCLEFLRSLFFEDIYARQEEIRPKYAKTYEWIFMPHPSGESRHDPSTRQLGPEAQIWDPFVSWLANGEGIYWINGKAGSGKSTLMNYIMNEQRTQTALAAWAMGEQLITPCYFFWGPGSKLQKSTTGLLRSLIYQIVEKVPKPMSLIRVSDPVLCKTLARNASLAICVLVTKQDYEGRITLLVSQFIHETRIYL